MKNNKGFTLIELLVVVAIIGMLSSVVLASLNSARNKGANAAVKSNLANARAEAEIFYDTNSTYDAVCANGAAVGTIGDNVTAAALAGGGVYTTADGTAQSAGVAVCHDSAAGWAAAASLKTSAGATAAWCVDSTGASLGVTATALAASDITCN